MQNSIRKRATFKFASDTTTDNEDDGYVLDEQEQEELIKELRKDSIASNRQYTLGLQGVITLSGLLHIIYLMNPSKQSPLLVFSPSTPPEPPIPFSPLFTLLALFVHINLHILIYPNRQSLTGITPLSHTPLYGISALAPCLSIFLARDRFTILWWCVAGSMVWIVHSIRQSVDRGDESISNLEGLRYIAPGA